MSSPEESAGREIMRLVEEQVGMGPRVPGTAPHDLLAQRLASCLSHAGAELTLQRFTVPFRGASLECVNVVGVIRSRSRSRLPPVLFGTHYDTRCRADRDPDPSLRETPIPGANDGGSGTAVLLHVLDRIEPGRLTRDVAIAFFDAEDLGNIDGKEFALGAAWLASHPLPGFTPAEVVVLDMVGGRDMVLDIDANVLTHAPSRRATTEMFRIGMAQGWQPFVGEKPNRVKYITSDQSPFARRGVAACLLIDIDYPQWHTQADLPEAMSPVSLGISEEALLLFLSRQPV